MGESSRFNKMVLVATQKILLPVISMKMFLILSERKIALIILLTSIHLVMEFGTERKDDLQACEAI